MDNTPTKRTSGNKLTTIERGHIQELIVSCLLRHYNRSTILNQCLKFNLSSRQIDKYIHKCREMIAKRPLETVDRAKRILVSMYEEELTRCEHSRDRIEVMKRLEKLYGLDDNTINIVHKDHDSIDTEKLIEITLDE